MAALFLIGSKSLNRRSKFVVSVVGGILLALAVLFQAWEDSSTTNRVDLLEAFSQGKTLNCGKFEVNATRFNYEYGTSTFIAKRGFNEVAGVKIPLSECLNLKENK